MASRRLRLGMMYAVEIFDRPFLRFAIQCVAFMGVAMGMFRLTATCSTPKGSIEYVRARGSLLRFHEALETYKLDCGEYPGAGVGLRALISNPGVKGWNGPYMKKEPRDPWNRPFLYSISEGAPLVLSLGADGKPGGTRYDSDISYRSPLSPGPRGLFDEPDLLLLIGSSYVLIYVRRISGRSVAPDGPGSARLEL